MEAGALVLLLVASLATASALSFYGDSINFMPLKKNQDGTVEATFHHRLNGRSSCTNQSTLECGSGVCTSFRRSGVLQTDQDATGQGRWCQLEGATTATAARNQTTLSLTASGCCWLSDGNGTQNWASEVELDLGTRSDSHSLNSCPVTSTVSSLRVHQNCFPGVQLLAHDPDGDSVRCSFSSGSTVSPNITLDEAACSLITDGLLDVGVHVFELLLQDFPSKDINLTYADGTSVFRSAGESTPLCKVKLQFSVEVIPPLPRCHPGHVMPVFLSSTPSQGDVLHATVGQTFHLLVQAVASHSSIHDFQLSGPQHMVKVFKDGVNGQAEVTLQWTPQRSDLYRFVPVCFTAESNESQSEMRCVVITVTQAFITQGNALVECSPNKMKVTLDMASMPGIDVKFLELMDPSCSLTSNGTHITGSMSFSTCGTKLEDAGDFISFKNEIDSFELPNEIITRRRRVKIGFSCQFPKTISVSSYYNLYSADYIFTESSFGSFGYTFEIFRNNNFTNRVEAKAYPVEVMLLQTIYMGIQAQSELPDVRLFVESCKATPDDNPENALSYDLIKNGCVQDETMIIFPSNRTSFNFGVQAFKFTSNYEQVFITCSVIMCEADSPFSRCAQGCQQNAARRRRRDLKRETVGHYITQGPLQFVDRLVPKSNTVNDGSLLKTKSDDHLDVVPPPASSGDWRLQQLLSANVGTVVLACALLLSLVTVAAVVHYFRSKRKEEGEHNALMKSGWEN